MAQLVKNPAEMQETWVRSLVWKDPLEEDTPVFWPGKSHGQRCLAGYNPWGHKESNTTDFISLHSGKNTGIPGSLSGFSSRPLP